MERSSRRRFLLAAGSAAVVAGCVGRPEESADQYGTPTRTGTTARSRTPDGTTTEPTTDGTTEQSGGTDTPAAVAWRSELGSPVTTVEAGSDAAFVGDESGDVLAVDPAGSERWTAATDGPVQEIDASGGLAFVVVGESDLYASHRVVAFEAATGQRRWEFAPEEWWLSVLGSHGGTVYVATSDDAIEPGGQTLYAVSRADGSVRWSGEVGDESGGLVTRDAVYVPTNGRIYAYGHDGQRRWTRDVEGYGHNSLVAVGDAVAFAADAGGDGREGRRHAGYGVGAAEGDDRWTLDDWFVSSFAVHDGRLFAGGERVVELDPATGETAWRFDPGGSIYDAPVADGTLFTSGRAVTAVDVADGAGRWTFETDLYLPEAVAVLGDTLYVHASTGRDDRNRHVLALDAAGGETRWRFDADAPLSEPVVVGDRPVAAGEDGVLYGFE